MKLVLLVDLSGTCTALPFSHLSRLVQAMVAEVGLLSTLVRRCMVGTWPLFSLALFLVAGLIR